MHLRTNKEIHENYKIIAPLYNTNIDYSILFKHSNILESELFVTLENYIKYRQEVPQSHTESTMITHIEGAVLGPIIVSLARKNCFQNLKNENLKWWEAINQDWQEIIKKLFIQTNLTDKNNQITEYGYFILKRKAVCLNNLIKNLFTR